MNKLRTDLLIAAPGFLLLVVGFLIPVAGILLLGVRDANGVLTATHLSRFLTDPFYLEIAWRTVKLSLIITALCIVAGFPLAYIMARGSARLRLWLIISITLPLMTSVVVRTFGWMVLLGRGGLIPDTLNMLGLVRRNYSLMQTETAVVLGMTQVLFPFMVLSILGVVMRIDIRLEEASRVMGCTFLKSLRLVVLPLAIPGVIAGSLLVFTLSASYFITPSLLGGARLPVLAGSIYETATRTLDWPFAAAQSIILVVGVLMLLIPYARLSRRANG
ncbi:MULTISPECIES: ABC transporter permease [Hyphomicrobiales]|uniref:AttA2-like ABC transporter permease n=2 Tax=Brucella TaxID=234 RepID=M5JU23_9HYPH|nr:MULTISPECIES: ABC transporter permease [Hyphomicrobiales]ELT46696.1 AttA2-like ABC transporter permease [Brucella intermedia M86]KAB2791318.1 ABC transporter permease [Brucella anthropi]RAL96061.1 ABC transporter permease [Agrobacterium sp. MS2]